MKKWSAKIVRESPLKVDPGAPHGPCSSPKDQVNADLLSILEAPAPGLAAARDSSTSGSQENPDKEKAK
jgi:hypothetical protein